MIRTEPGQVSNGAQSPGSEEDRSERTNRELMDDWGAYPHDFPISADPLIGPRSGRDPAAHGGRDIRALEPPSRRVPAQTWERGRGRTAAEASRGSEKPARAE
jgi:hypothetical protein